MKKDVPRTSWNIIRIWKNGVPKNPEINKIKKKVPRKNRKIWQGWKFPSTSKTGTLLYLHCIPSNPVSIHIRNAGLYPVKSFDEKLYTAVHIPCKSASWVLDTGRLTYTVKTWKIPYYLKYLCIYSIHQRYLIILST